MPDPTTTPLADLLADTATYLDAHHLDDDVLSINYAKPYGDRPIIRVHLRSSVWSALAAGQPITWDARPGDATGIYTPPTMPWLHLISTWTPAELAAIAPDVAAMVFPPQVRYSAGAWPGGVRS